MFSFIEIDKIAPHPDNPRKDLGDLTELAESIKANGVLQNLTVIPWFSEITRAPADDGKMDDHYRVVIGHRRLAAAKLAGHVTVPCIISSMSPREQVATMLLENMQRNDLTVYEQASGFQMMLNFGETINTIAEKTGFSETTVRRRVDLLELDQEKLKKSIDRGATLMDYAELKKIKDIDLRNSVLEHIGTPNFQWKFKSAIEKEVTEKRVALIVAELEKFATQIKDSSGMRYVVSYRDNKIDVPEDVDTTEYFFVVSDYGYVTLYTKIKQTDINVIPTLSEKQKEVREQHAALDEISKRAYQLRHEFILEYPNTKAKNNISTIIEYFIWNLLYDDCYLDGEKLAEALNFQNGEEDDEWKFNDIADQVKTKPEYHLLITTYLALDTGYEHYYDWNNQHVNNDALNAIYDFLEKLGYELSDEEQALRDGTHELFAPSKE